MIHSLFWDVNWTDVVVAGCSFHWEDGRAANENVTTLKDGRPAKR
jgi:hypothetical protein